MPSRSALLVALSLVAATATATRDEPPTLPTDITQEVPTTCAITKPPARPFIPPKPWPDRKHPNQFWFGTRKLWTILPVDGTWRGLPHYTPDDPTFRQKLIWWRRGNDARTESVQKLAVTGQRLDAPAPPVHVDPIPNGWPRPDQMFKVVGVNFPTLGCWQIKAQYHDAEVTYVVWLAQ